LQIIADNVSRNWDLAEDIFFFSFIGWEHRDAMGDCVFLLHAAALVDGEVQTRE